MRWHAGGTAMHLNGSQLRRLSQDYTAQHEAADQDDSTQHNRSEVSTPSHGTATAAKNAAQIAAEASGCRATSVMPLDDMPAQQQSLMIVSNRLPRSVTGDPVTGEWDLPMSTGGLVSALLRMSQVCGFRSVTSTFAAQNLHTPCMACRARMCVHSALAHAHDAQQADCCCLDTSTLAYTCQSCIGIQTQITLPEN